MNKIQKLFTNNAFACFAAGFCTLLWGTAFPFIKLGYSAFEIADGDIGAQILLAGLRFFIAGVMVYAFLCFTLKKPAAPSRRDVVPVCLLGLVQTAAQYIFTYIGIGMTTGANTSIITACASFFTVLTVALFFKGERLTALKLVGCALGFAGVLSVNHGGAIGLNTLSGDLLILCSTASAAAGNIIAKKVSRNINPISLTAFQLMLGGFLLIVAGFAAGGRLNFNNAECAAILLWLAFVSAAAFSVWTTLLKYHPAAKISIFNLLVPVFGTALSGILLGEDVFKAETLISLLLISAGIAAVNLSTDKS